MVRNTSSNGAAARARESEQEAIPDDDMMPTEISCFRVELGVLEVEERRRVAIGGCELAHAERERDARLEVVPPCEIAGGIVFGECGARTIQ